MTGLRKPELAVGVFILLLCALCARAQVTVPIEPVLGPAPTAPFDVSALPGKGPRKLNLTPAMTVNGTSREQVRQFYNAVYPASGGIPIDSSAGYRGLRSGHEFDGVSRGGAGAD